MPKWHFTFWFCFFGCFFIFTFGFTFGFIGYLEKQNKIATKKKEKLENQNISQSIKPHKPVKMPKLHNHRPSPQVPLMAQKKYTEYRSILLPILAGGTWAAYKSIQTNPTETEYNQIMGSILTSPDLNDLIRDQLTYFDSTNELTKTIMTCLSKAVNTAGKRAISNQSLPEQPPLPEPESYIDRYILR